MLGGGAAGKSWGWGCWVKVGGWGCWMKVGVGLLDEGAWPLDEYSRVNCVDLFCSENSRLSGYIE